MILTENQIIEIVNEYAKEKNIDIQKYNLYNVKDWYSWWWQQTLYWKRSAVYYTYEEGKEEIRGYLHYMIYQQDWDEKYGYKGIYDGCRKICTHCKYSTWKYEDQICYITRGVFCTKILEKYNIFIAIRGDSDICKYYESIFPNDKFDFEEYYDWLCKAWYVNNKGKTTINLHGKSVYLNDIIMNVPYTKFKDLDFIEGNNIICTTYHGGKWTKKNGYKIQGKDYYNIDENKNK